MDSLTDAYDKDLISDAIFFDFAKAFDRVPHQPLLYKLWVYGIRGNLHQWIKSFLENRSFKVKVGPELSFLGEIKSGVPQGSVLGPLLFLLYVNDLPEQLSVNCLLFADDLKIWSSNDPDGLQMDIDTVKRWSKDWGLPINDLKCAHMSFGGESGNGFYILEEDPPVVIPKAYFKRDLGVLLSESFSYTAHHEQVARKAFGVLRMIQRSFPRIARHDFQVLYGTYIRPCLEYANQVVASGLVKDANILERVQRKATKIVRGLHDLPYEQRLQILDLFPLETRRIRGDLIFTFSLFKNGSASELFQLILPQSNMIFRGHQKKIYKKRPRTYIRQHFFSFRVVNYWNALPSVVVNASSKDLFKKGIDNWLKSEHPRKGLT
jgi:hypothetical protein